MKNPAATMMDAYQHQLDASRQIADTVFECTDRVEHLMLETTRQAFGEQLKFYQALAAVRDPKGVSSLQSTFFSHTPEQMAKVQSELTKIVTDAQKQINHAFEEYQTSLNGQAFGAANPFTATERLTRDAQDSVNPMTNLYSMWDQAFKDTMKMATNTMNDILKASPTEEKDSAQQVSVQTSASARKRNRHKVANVR